MGMVLQPASRMPTGVWDDGGLNYYKGVWHLNQSFADSTTYGNNGTNNGTTDTSGKIANGRDFENNPTPSNQYISVADNASLHISDYITVEAWVNPETVGVWETIVSKMRTGAQEDLYFVLDDSTSSLFVGLSGAYLNWDSGVDITDGSWQHVAMTYNGSNLRVYRNGAQTSVGATGTLDLATNTDPLYMGYNTGWTNELWDGQLDEVRISNYARPGTWISTEFNNQDDPGPGAGSFFKSLGSEEQATPPPFTARWAPRLPRWLVVAPVVHRQLRFREAPLTCPIPARRRLPPATLRPLVH